MSSDAAIATTLEDLRGSLRTARPLAAGDDEGSREWRLLRALAERDGRLEHGPHAARGVGGHEHEVLHLREERRWEKATFWDKAGFVADVDDWMLLPATPLQYLERLHLSNILFGDDVAFRCVEAEGYHTRIVTSQRDVVGQDPTWQALHGWLEAQGYARIEGPRPLGAYDAEAWRRGRVHLFDVHPGNVVLTPPGELIPIDIICQLA